jgi:hypothetical protein
MESERGQGYGGIAKTKFNRFFYVQFKNPSPVLTPLFNNCKNFTFFNLRCKKNQTTLKLRSQIQLIYIFLFTFYLCCLQVI